MNNIQVPNKYSLAEFTGLPRFKGTEDGKAEKQLLRNAQQQYNKQLTYCKVAKWVAIVFGILLMGTAIWLSVVLWIVAYGFSKNGFITNQFTKKYNVAFQRYQNYIQNLINFTAQKFFNNQYRWANFNNVYMIYSNLGLVYVNVAQDLLVAYKKQDIKEIIRDRVHTGSHSSSTGTTVGGGTASSHLVNGIFGRDHVRTNGIGVARNYSNTDTTDFYEWHFDIMTDFMGYPKVSLVIPDNSSNENTINEMYAVLKP